MIALGDSMQRMNGRIVSLSAAMLTMGGNMFGATADWWRDMEGQARQRHNGKGNVSFCDGHVESIKLPRLFGVEDASLRRWNNDHLPHRERLNTMTVTSP
jgi:prepilin-type processing-associated H-X9-DG protein